jgi:hypothetical protein
VSNQIQLSISSLPDFQLDKGAFKDNSETLPGLEVDISGNVVDSGNKTLTYTNADINGFVYYNLTYTFDPAEMQEDTPELIVSFTKTTPPQYSLYVD